MVDHSEDQALVKRVQDGDKQAFNLLVLKYQSRINHLVSRFLRNTADVEDVTQDAFIKAYKALKNFRGDSQFYTWMYRIAINTAKNHLVSSSRRRPAGATLDAQEAEQYEGAYALQESATPDREIQAEEIKQTVNKAIAALPEDLRAAITLRELEGLNYEEIALVMDCPIGTVRSRIFRAREAIDKQLKPHLDD